MSAIREQILRTASELPELQGYRATGLNQIVKESGAPKGFLFYYYYYYNFPEGENGLTDEALQRPAQLVGSGSRNRLPRSTIP